MNDSDNFESRVQTGLAELADRIACPTGLAERLIAAPSRVNRRVKRVRPAALIAAAIVVAAIAFIGSLVAVKTGGHGSANSSRAEPVYTQGGDDPHLPKTFCPAQPPARSPAPATARITVDPAPSFVLAVWFPGTTLQPCSGGASHGEAEIAQQLAADIRAAPAWPAGAYSCPDDDGGQIQLYFTYPDNKTETVTVTISGCPSIIAAGRGPNLHVTQRLSSDLQMLKPPTY